MNDKAQYEREQADPELQRLKATAPKCCGKKMITSKWSEGHYTWACSKCHGMRTAA